MTRGENLIGKPGPGRPKAPPIERHEVHAGERTTIRPLGFSAIINIGTHYGSVIVFGATQDEADSRAAILVKGANNIRRERWLRAQRKLKAKAK